MRLVTILILFTLAAAAYVANFAAKDRQPSSGAATELASGMDSVDGADGAAALGDGTLGDRALGDRGPVDGAMLDGTRMGVGGGNEPGLPAEFPSELTRRSGGSSTSVAGAAGSQAAATNPRPSSDGAGSGSKATPTRRRVAPIVRQPSAEENAERDRLVAKRFGTKSSEASDGSTAAESAMGSAAEAVDESMAESNAGSATAPGASPPADQVITLPARKPARERTVKLQGVEPQGVETEAPTPSAEVAAAPEVMDDGADSAMRVIEENPTAIADEAAATTDALASKPADSKPAAQLATAQKPAGQSPAAQYPTGQNPAGAKPAGDPSIRVRVIDSNGRPVPDVQLSVINAATDRATAQIQAGEDGSAATDALNPGRYRLQVMPKSVPLTVSRPIGVQQCRVPTQPAGYGSVCVDVAAGGSTVLADVVLPLSSGVQGTILGKTGAPVKGVLVRAISRVAGFEEHRIIAETNEKGFFFFGLVPGPYQLQMLLPGKGRPEELTRSMEIVAKPGSALLLDAVDFSKKAPQRQSRAAEPQLKSQLSSQTKPKVAAAMEPVIQPATEPATTPAIIPEPKLAAMPAPKNVTPTPSKAEKVAVASPRLEVLESRIATQEAASKTLSAAVPVEPVLRAQAPSRVTRSRGKPGRVELRGRVISKWGETVPALSVTVESSEGRILEATQTSDNGQYILEDVPVGIVIVRVASNLEINRKGRYGTTLLKRPSPVRVQTFEGQNRVSLKDVVVDIRRIYRLAGRIKVQPEALAEFHKSLGRINEGQPPLTDNQLRRAYYRGLRLTQKNRGSKEGKKNPLTALGQAIQIHGDGTFVWTCPLPAEDILLVLEPRSSRKSSGYAGPIGIPVTPAGVRPAELEIVYPPVAKKVPGDGASLASTTSK